MSVATAPAPNCPVCRRGRSETFCRKSGKEYRQCSNCTHVFLTTPPESEDITKYYSDRTSHHSSTTKQQWDYSEAKFDNFYMPLLKRIERLSNGKQILDVGCSNGAFLKAAERRGWSAEGLELETSSYQVALQNGLHVRNEDLVSCAFPDQAFDIVTMWQLIEHLSAPREFITEIKRILRPGGLLVISTPNVQSIAWKLLREQWGAVEPEVHLHLFTVKSLKYLIQDVGFETKAIETLDIKPSTLKKALLRSQSGLAKSKSISVAEFASKRTSAQIGLVFRVLGMANFVLKPLGLGEDIYGYFENVPHVKLGSGVNKIDISIC